MQIAVRLQPDSLMLATPRRLFVALVALMRLSDPSIAQSIGAPMPPIAPTPGYHVDRLLEDGATQIVTVWAHGDNLNGHADLVIVCDENNKELTVSDRTLQTRDLYPIDKGACSTLLKDADQRIRSQGR